MVDAWIIVSGGVKTLILPEYSLGRQDPRPHLPTHVEVGAAGLLCEVPGLGAGVDGAGVQLVLRLLLGLHLGSGGGVQLGREVEG